MASYKNTLLESFLSYPSLYHNKEEKVLEHYFFVIGNGMEWKNGQLVYGGFGEPKSMEKRIAKIWEDRFHRESTQNMAKTSHILFPEVFPEPINLEEWTEAYYPKTIDDPLLLKIIDWDIKHHKALFKDKADYKKIYPICEYSGIYTIPKNVKPDWLAAADKAYQLAVNGYWETTDSDKQWLVKIGQLIQQRKSK